MVLFAALAPAAALAGVFYNYPPNHQNTRANMEGAWLVRVKPGGRAYFYNDLPDIYPGCPAATAKCRRKGFVVPGDIAVAAYAIGAFTVVDFVGPTGSSSDGAIETRLLERLPPPTPAPADWLGHWSDGAEQEITMRAGKSAGSVAVKGDATWGAGDPERVKRGGVNIGEIGGAMHPRGQWGGLIDDAKTPEPDWSRGFPYQKDGGYDCQVRFRLLGPYLLAQDDGNNCGGMNVTFSGVYRRVPARRH